MERYAWKAKIKNGMYEEYKKRHDEIWTEMIDVLKEAGISNYSIFSDGEDLFGYYECEKGVEYAAKVQANSETVARWNVYMSNAMTMECDKNTGAQPKLNQVFYLK